MNILQVITIHAGGPGSGPNAPCPQCGPHGGKQIEKGDTVKMKPGAQVFNPNTGEKYHFAPGTKLRVVHVMPKIGNADQIVSVTTGKKDDDVRSTAYAKMDDLVLHKSGIVHLVSPGPVANELPKWADPTFKNPKAPGWKELDIQPVPKSQVQVKYKTADGANVTVVRPAEQKEKDLRDLTKEEHRFKGQFERTNTIKSEKEGTHTTRVYTTSSYPAHLQGAGATVWVHRYPDRVVIQEQNTAKHGYKITGITTFEYKNIGKAFGMMKSRYGISIKLSNTRF